MASVSDIKKAIKRLPDSKRRALSRWLIEQENDAWDRQMEQDAASGKLQFLLDEVEVARKQGKLKKFP